MSDELWDERDEFFLLIALEMKGILYDIIKDKNPSHTMHNTPNCKGATAKPWPSVDRRGLTTVVWCVGMSTRAKVPELRFHYVRAE